MNEDINKLISPGAYFLIEYGFRTMKCLVVVTTPLRVKVLLQPDSLFMTEWMYRKEFSDKKPEYLGHGKPNRWHKYFPWFTSPYLPPEEK